MKKIYLTLILIIAPLCLSAQLQLELQYDFRHLLSPQVTDRLDRPVLPEFVVLTTQYTGADKYGSTYFFSDFSFNGSDYGVGKLYFEIQRDLKFWEAPVSLHLEYNGGFQFASATDVQPEGITYSNAAIFGVGSENVIPCTAKHVDFMFVAAYLTYRLSINRFTFDPRTLTAGKKNSHDALLTLVWDFQFFNEKLQLCGFADLASGNDASGLKKQFEFMSEPQIWYYPLKNLAVGGEVELNYNYFDREPNLTGFYAFPSVGVKWIIKR